MNWRFSNRNQLDVSACFRIVHMFWYTWPVEKKLEQTSCGA